MAANDARALFIHSVFSRTNACTVSGRVLGGTTTSTRPRGKTLMESLLARLFGRTEKPDAVLGSSVSENNASCRAASFTGPILRWIKASCRYIEQRLPSTSRL